MQDGLAFVLRLHPHAGFYPGRDIFEMMVCVPPFQIPVGVKSVLAQLRRNEEESKRQLRKHGVYSPVDVKH